MDRLVFTWPGLAGIVVVLFGLILLGGPGRRTRRDGAGLPAGGPGVRLSFSVWSILVHNVPAHGLPRLEDVARSVTKSPG